MAWNRCTHHHVSAAMPGICMYSHSQQHTYTMHHTPTHMPAYSHITHACTHMHGSECMCMIVHGCMCTRTVLHALTLLPRVLVACPSIVWSVDVRQRLRSSDVGVLMPGMRGGCKPKHACMPFAAGVNPTSCVLPKSSQHASASSATAPADLSASKKACFPAALNALTRSATASDISYGPPLPCAQCLDSGCSCQVICMTASPVVWTWVDFFCLRSPDITFLPPVIDYQATCSQPCTCKRSMYAQRTRASRAAGNICLRLLGLSSLSAISCPILNS